MNHLAELPEPDVDSNNAWAMALSEYQREPTPDAAGRLLSLFGERLNAIACTFTKLPMGTDHEDVSQQLILEVLEAASRIRRHAEPRWIPRMLLETAIRRLCRWLFNQGWVPPEVLDAEATSVDDHSEIPEDLPVSIEGLGGLSRSDLSLLYRYRVLRLPAGDIAAAEGVRLDAMWQRLSRTERRLRSGVEASHLQFNGTRPDSRRDANGRSGVRFRSRRRS